MGYCVHWFPLVVMIGVAASRASALLSCTDIDLHTPTQDVDTDHASAEHFWEAAAHLDHNRSRAGGGSHHIVHGHHMHSQARARAISRVHRWKSGWLAKWAAGGWLEGKTVGDYGCGGGLLGEVLCSDYRTRKYTCVDIAERQLQVVEQRFDAIRKNGGGGGSISSSSSSSSRGSGGRECELGLVKVEEGDGGIVDWHSLTLDAVVSHHTIEHFPSERYTVTWLCSLAQARVHSLALEVRHGTPVAFSEWSGSYNRESATSEFRLDTPIPARIKHATRLNCAYLLERLPGYALTWSNISGRGRDGTDFAFCAFQYQGAGGSGAAAGVAGAF